MKDEMLKRQKTSCNRYVPSNIIQIICWQLLLLQTTKQFVLLLVKLELP